MNNPKTIEAIKEAVGKITSLLNSAPHVQIVWAGAMRETKEKLQEALNSLQEEPTSDEHPLHAGFDFENVKAGRHSSLEGDYSLCPWCDGSAHAFGSGCGAKHIATVKVASPEVPVYLWLAPPAPVKEPEDEWEVTPLGPREAAMLCQNVYQKENPNNLHVLAYWRADDKLTCMTCPHDGCDASREVQPLGRATFLLVERRKQQGAH